MSEPTCLVCGDESPHRFNVSGFKNVYLCDYYGGKKCKAKFRAFHDCLNVHGRIVKNHPDYEFSRIVQLGIAKISMKNNHIETESFLDELLEIERKLDSGIGLKYL